MIDWIVDIACVLICFIPYILNDMIGGNFNYENRLIMMVSFYKAASFSIIAYVLLNMASYYPELMMFFISINDENRDDIARFYYNMLNLIKLITIPSLAILMPVYAYFQLPTIFLLLPLVILILFIAVLFLKQMNKEI